MNAMCDIITQAFWRFGIGVGRSHDEPASTQRRTENAHQLADSA
jgi:hypothetical protein